MDRDIGVIVRRLFKPDDTDTASDSGTMDRLRALALEETCAGRRGKAGKKEAQEIYEAALMLIYKYQPGRWGELEHIFHRAGFKLIERDLG